MEQELFLPVLSHFENGNFWTASGGRMRYRVDPVKEEDVWTTLKAQVWEGPFGYALSEVEETASFPLSGPGLEELRAWVGRWSAAINARPPRSLAENLERRAALQVQKAQNPEENA